METNWNVMVSSRNRKHVSRSMMITAKNIIMKERTWINRVAQRDGGLRPEPREPELHEPGAQRAGWQHEAASRVERHFRAEHILPHLTPTRRAMLRSQSGPVAGIPFSVAPSSFLTRLEPAPSSGSCFRGFSPCFSPCPNAVAGVAVSSTPLWRVRLQGCAKLGGLILADCVGRLETSQLTEKSLLQFEGE